MIRLVLAVVLFLYTCESILAQVALRQIKKGELEEAVARADEKVARLKKRNSRPENSPGLSQSKWEDKYIVEGLFEAAETYYYCGQFGKARELLEWCLVVYARDKPAETRKNNLCTLRLAETLIETGDYARAEQLTDQLKSKINLNPLSVEEAVEIKVRYSDIANVYQQIGRIAKANAVFEETLEFFLAKVNGKKTNKVVNSLVVTSDTYAFFEFYKRGSAALQYYTETAQYEKGEALAQTLVQLGEIKFGQDDYAYATVLDKQGELFLAMGRYDQALKIYLRCNDLANEAKKKSNLNYGWVNARLADCYFALGRYEDAKRHYQAASDIANDKSGMRADMLSTYVVIGLSSTLNRISAHSDALRVGLNGLDQYDKFSYQAKYWGEKRTELRFNTGLYTGIGVAYRGLKNYDSAQYFLQKAYDLQRGFPQFRAKTAMQMAELQAVVGHHEQAVALYKESLDTWLSFWDNNVFSLSENERSDFFASISEAMNSFTAYAVRKVGQTPTLIDDLYNYQLLTKGVLLNSSEKVRSRILGSGNSTLINAYNQWQSDRLILILFYKILT